MKKKILILTASIFAFALLIGATTAGVNELGLIGNGNLANAAETSKNATLDLVPVVNLQAGGETASVNGGVQEIVTQLEPFSYPTLIVQKGVPVKWTMVASAANLNSCNDEIIIPALGMSKKLNVGENVFEFTVDEAGTIQYSCWMNMITAAIVVVDDINNYDAAEIDSQIAQLPQSGGCGGMGGATGGGGCCGGIMR